MKKYCTIVFLLFLLVLQSCATKKDMLYFQDLDRYNNSDVTYVSSKIQPNDILKITVTDLNPVVAQPFNISAGGQEQNSVELMKLTGYLVSHQGTITMPVLEKVEVLGLSPTEIEAKIKDRLIKEGYLVNPTVIVRVVNNKFTILGEVRAPGVKTFTEESISFLDALGMAGDITSGAVRGDVKLIRQVDGKQVVHHIDLRTAAWMNNPDYRIRQNDLIMVTPNKWVVNSAGVLKDPVQSLGILISLVTLYFLINR